MYNERITLTPQEILDKEFKIDARGYRPQEVDKALDIVISDYKAYDRKVKDLEAIFTEPQLLERIKAMSKLQPLRQGEAVVTKQQIIDAINVAEINDPKLLDKVFTEFTKGASKDQYRFVSNKKLYNFI